MSQPRGRPFVPGNTLGRGRPKGSPNAEKSPAQSLIDQYAEPLTSKCIALAMQGNAKALAICMGRISPPRRDSLIRFPLPKIRTAKDLDKAMEKITQAIRRGEITPGEGVTMMNVLESRSRSMESVQMENRLEELEKKAAQKQPPKGFVKR